MPASLQHYDSRDISEENRLLVNQSIYDGSWAVLIVRRRPLSSYCEHLSDRFRFLSVRVADPRNIKCVAVFGNQL